MVWKVEFSELGRKGLAKPDRPVAARILKFLAEQVAVLDDPRSIGEALKGAEPGEFWKYPVGDFRNIARIEDRQLRILVVRIFSRRDVYR